MYVTQVILFPAKSAPPSINTTLTISIWVIHIRSLGIILKYCLSLSLSDFLRWLGESSRIPTDIWFSAITFKLHLSPMFLTSGTIPIGWYSSIQHTGPGKMKSLHVVYMCMCVAEEADAEIKNSNNNRWWTLRFK